MPTRKRDLRAGNRPSKNQRVEGEISIVQSIQLGFSRSLGSATSNEANKSARWPKTEKPVFAKPCETRICKICET